MWNVCCIDCGFKAELRSSSYTPFAFRSFTTRWTIRMVCGWLLHQFGWLVERISGWMDRKSLCITISLLMYVYLYNSPAGDYLLLVELLLPIWGRMEDGQFIVIRYVVVVVPSKNGHPFYRSQNLQMRHEQSDETDDLIVKVSMEGTEIGAEEDGFGKSDEQINIDRPFFVRHRKYTVHCWV